MTPAQFKEHWIDALPLHPPAPRLADFQRAQLLTHHFVEVDTSLCAASIWGAHPGGTFSIWLHAVACLQLRRDLARIDGTAYGEPPSRQLATLALTLPPVRHNKAWAARADVVAPGRVVLRSATVIDGEKGFFDLRLDCGLSETLGRVTWGDNWFARALAQFDAAVP